MSDETEAKQPVVVEEPVKAAEETGAPRVVTVEEKTDLDEEELDLLEGEDRVPKAPAEEPDLSDSPNTTVPPWAAIPKDIKFPPAGCLVAFIRIPASYCRDPKQGDQQCIVWALDEHDEEMAWKRARGEPARTSSELAKGCIRAVNGRIAEWGELSTIGSVHRFWRAIGPKGRQLIRTYYVQTHQLDTAETIDFFSKHFAFVTVQRA